jgi:hypothetical protein
MLYDIIGLLFIVAGSLVFVSGLFYVVGTVAKQDKRLYDLEQRYLSQIPDHVRQQMED